MGGVHQFGIHGKLAPQYVGPYKVLKQCSLVVDCLQLPSILSTVHNVFHVSQLKKCLRVLDEAVEVEGLPLQLDLTYVEHPVRVLDEKKRVMRNSVVKFYKVQWQNDSEDEATWEQESYPLQHYPHLLAGSDSQLLRQKCISYLFLTLGTRNLGSRFCFRGVDLKHPRCYIVLLFPKILHEHSTCVYMYVIYGINQFMELKTFI